MSPEFRAGERVVEVSMPCCECGQESEAYASFLEQEGGAKQWMCKACCDRDLAAV